MATSASDLQQLRVILLKAASGLPELVEKRMFGCAALFTKGNIFALVWKHGRLGLRLPEQADYDELMQQEGAEPWAPGPQMAHWVLVPAELHANSEELAAWVKRAHGLAQARREAQQKASAEAAQNQHREPTATPAPKPAADKRPAASAPAPAPKKASKSTVPPASKKKPAAKAAAKSATKSAAKPAAKKTATRGR